MLNTRVVLATTVTVFIFAAGAFSLPNEQKLERPVQSKQTAVIRVVRQSPSVWPLSNERVESQDEYLTLLETYAKLLKSHFVINAALRNNPELAELAQQASGKSDPSEWLAEQISTTTCEGELISISFRHAAIADASQRVKFVNAVLNAFWTEILNYERDQVFRRRNSLELTLEKSRKEQQEKSRTIAERRRQQGEDIREIKLRLAEQRLAEFSRRRDEIAFHKMALEADRDERLKANEKKEPVQDVAEDETVRGLDSQIRVDDYQIAQIDSQITAQYDHLSEMQSRSIDLASKMRELEQNQAWIDKLGVRLHELKADLPSRVSILQMASAADADK